MEKEFSKRILAIKKDIIQEIGKKIGRNGNVEFRPPVYVHYVEGEVATTERCFGAIVGDDLSVSLKIEDETGYVSEVSGGDLMGYEAETLLYVLEASEDPLRPSEEQQKLIENARVALNKLNGAGVELFHDTQTGMLFALNSNNVAEFDCSDDCKNKSHWVEIAKLGGELSYCLTCDWDNGIGYDTK